MTSTTILLYNTHLFADTVPTLRTILDDDDRTDAMVRTILERQPDIVALCEVWADRRAARVAEALSGSYRSHFRPTTSSGFVMSSGLLLLSRLPIHRVSFTHYYDSAGSRSADMGYITAELSTPEGDGLLCRLILSHDQATFDNDIERYAAIRTQNRAKIQSTVSEFPRDDVPLIVTGDLNVIAETHGHPTDEYRKMCDQYGRLGLVDMYRALYPNPERDPAQWGLTYSGSTNPLLEAFDGVEMARSEQRLDYFWVSASTRSGWQKCAVEPSAYQYQRADGDTWPASDHYPLEATLTL